MTNVLRIRRRASGSPGAPSSLWDSELAYNFVDDIIYLGKGTGGAGGTATSILAVGGKGAFMDLSSDQTIGGIKTFTNQIDGTALSATKLSTARSIAMSGDVVWSTTFDGSGNVTAAGTIQALAVTTGKLNDSAVTNAKLADIASARIKGRITAGTGAVEDLTQSQVLSFLGVTGGASVSSVDLALPNIFSVSGNPVTTSGTLTASLVTQNANIVFAGPTSGGAAVPTFRSLVAADIPSITSAKISDFDSQVRTNRLDQMATPTGSVSMGTQKITNLLDPTNPQDAASKAYVDATATGLSVKAAVRAATTANITLSGTQTVDGVSLSVNDRVLVKNQSSPASNGIYLVASGSWTRSTDMDVSAEVTSGAFTFVSEGTTNANTSWVLSTPNPITLGSTSLTFTQFGSAGSFTAGNGMTLTGNTFDVVGTTDRIVANADSIDIASTYVGQTSITTLGTIGTGTWNATAIGLAKGGTNADISGFSTGAILMKGSTAVVAAVAGTDYLSPSSTIDGGTF